MASGDGAEEAVGQHPLDAATSSRLVIVDGVVSPELSSMSSMPDGVYIGGIENAPSQAVSQQLVSHDWSFIVFTAISHTEHVCKQSD